MRYIYNKLHFSTNISLKLFFLVCCAVLISCGNNKNDKAAQQAAGATPAKDYKVLELRPRDATLNTDYPASIQGQENIEIRPKVDGFVKKIYVDEGTVVHKGQPLFRIDAPQYEQEVRAATASVLSAEADVSASKLAVNKVKPLVEKDIVSKYELESAQFTYQTSLARLAQARAELANARTNLGYTLVTSPVNGVVGSIPYRLGSLVSSSTAEPLTTVSSIGNVFAYFAINENLLLSFNKEVAGKSFEAKLKTLPPVSLILSDGTLYNKKGTIQTVNGLINTQTGAANVRASFPNPNGLIRSGSFATVRIPNEVKSAILVPQSATYELQDKRFVVIADKDNKTKAVAITVLPNAAGQFFVVEKGLKAGDKIVLEGVATLKDGTPIKAVMVNSESVYAGLK
ncbi:efflux RND transporter periplasmic adaptor subunit [Pedobacter sp.]|uniref:efflux RND transporter periplasmic adaptor subunit n=1 Tax=Pedobacter sp. TaxID=1411316 RepID=UPI003D7F8CDC